MSHSQDFPLAPNAVDRHFQRRLLERLTAQLNDATTAATEVSYLADVFFSFELPDAEPRSFNAILAFGFGNRASGSSASPMPLPGPVNAAIADAVFGLWRRNPLPVYAQWEVAQVLATKYPQMNGMVWSLSAPVVAANGSVSVPSLDAVVSAATALASVSALGKVAVVTHRDLAKLATQTARAHGLDAWAAASVRLPQDYDLQARQTQYRQRDLFLVYDLFLQLGNLRTQLIAQEYPNG